MSTIKSATNTIKIKYYVKSTINYVMNKYAEINYEEVVQNDSTLATSIL